MQVKKKDKPEQHESRRANVAELVTRLGSRNGAERQRVRSALVSMGEPAVGPLIAALSSDRHVVRWEAAKAFTELNAPAAAPALVKTLADQDVDVRWLAAEALIGLGESALVPLFECLMARSDSIELREGAHHVLHALNHGDLAEIAGPVLITLENYEPELAIPFSAEEALNKLRRSRS